MPGALRWIAVGLQRLRYVVVVGVAAVALMAAVTFAWSVAKLASASRNLLSGEWRSDIELAALLQALDLVIVGTVFMLIALGLWSLFVGILDLPEPLIIRSLDELEAKVAVLLVLVVAINLVERFFLPHPSSDLLREAGAFAIFGATLIALKLALGATHVPAMSATDDREAKQLPVERPVEGREPRDSRKEGI